ncbi:hypothetical protein BMS3Bbin02_01752 [bacterium BMS3Bbin02]|nr:hypothetical protein BMS3Bbin02_01752 [bacterium BMS3Bbin02]
MTSWIDHPSGTTASYPSGTAGAVYPGGGGGGVGRFSARAKNDAIWPRVTLL